MDSLTNTHVLRKSVSTFQKRINIHKKRINTLIISIEEKNHAITLMNSFITKLMEEGRITKEEMVAAIKSRKHTKQAVKEHRQKHNIKPNSL